MGQGMKEATTNVVKHKYGENAGKVCLDSFIIFNFSQLQALDTVGNIGMLTEVYMIAGTEQISK